MKNIKALIFDVDGTLAETEELHRKAFNKTFHQNNLGWCWDKAMYKKLLTVAGGKERIKFYSEKFSSSSTLLQSKHIQDIHTQKTGFYLAFVKMGLLKLRPGVKELINIARKRKKIIAIATSTSRKNVDYLIKSCFGRQPEDIFSFISSGEMVEKKKPSPDLYNLVLESLCLRPEDCLAFEDNSIGLISAKRAKLETVVTPSYYSSEENFDDADFLIDNLLIKKLPENLKKRIVA